MKPGMFAEIGLGTNVRNTLLIPADGVLHVGQSDYVFVGCPGRPMENHAHSHGRTVRKTHRGPRGLQPGDRVIGAGAILLKPYVVQDVQAIADAAAGNSAALAAGKPGKGDPLPNPLRENSGGERESQASTAISSADAAGFRSSDALPASKGKPDRGSAGR